MLKLVMMITIVDRNQSEDILSFFNNNGVSMTLGRYGRGTATDVILNYLGIAEKEKCIAFSFTTIETAIEVIRELKEKVKGVYGFVIPISSVGGKVMMEHFKEDVVTGENKDYKFNEEMILIITNRGYVDTVMDIARKNGAPGGTVVHARGTGIGNSEKFFGVTVGAEKEMIFIIVNRKIRNDIMKNIMKEAGNDSPAQSIVFSLPAMQLE